MPPPPVTTQVAFGAANGTSHNWGMHGRKRNIGRDEPVNQAGGTAANQAKFIDREDVKALAQQRRLAEDTLANQKVELLTAEAEQANLKGQAKKDKANEIKILKEVIKAQANFIDTLNTRYNVLMNQFMDS